MEDFFSNYGLYSPYPILENYQLGNEYYYSPLHFNSLTFDYHCEIENKVKTFELKYDFQSLTPEQRGAFTNKDFIDDCLIIDNKLNYTFFCPCKCLSCNDYHIYVMLNVYSNNVVARAIDNIGNRNYQDGLVYSTPADTHIYIQKVGLQPEFKPSVDKVVLKYLSRDAQSWYYKANLLQSKGLGIGAFAYYRRIIENELIEIIRHIKKLPDAHTQEINKLLEEYERRPDTATIYENIFKHLPNSLKILGDNPIKLLYNQTSEGLHSLSEADCLARSQHIALILEFTLKKINEERSDIQALKNAINSLKQ